MHDGNSPFMFTSPHLLGLKAQNTDCSSISSMLCATDSIRNPAWKRFLRGIFVTLHKADSQPSRNLPDFSNSAGTCLPIGSLFTGSSKRVTLQTMADDVAGVVETLKLGPVHMAGNDSGNRVARMFAASHPELTRSVILLAAGGKIQPKPPAAHALQVIFNPASTDANVLAVMPYLDRLAASGVRFYEV
jgi:hypothetical protein